MSMLLLLGVGVAASLVTPFDEVVAAAEANGIVPTVIPSLSLETLLSVNFSQPDGNYTNCGKLYEFPATTFSLNDTGVTSETPWNTRSYRPTHGSMADYFQYTPEIAWTSENNSTLFTLMMVDPLFILDPSSQIGPFVQHYMVINIEGNNISSGHVVNPFLGPAASGPAEHKYLFLLYAQNEPVALSPNETLAIQKRVNFNVSAFVTAHNLTNTTGINWVNVKGDTWGPVELDALGLVKLDCINYVADTAEKIGIVPNVLPYLNLTTHLGVQYTQPDGNYTNCGRLYVNPAINFTLNDTGMTQQSPWNARSYRPTPAGGAADYMRYQPAISWKPRDATLYALLMVDVGEANSSFPEPYIQHWMVLNIPGNNISAGEVINPLAGPAPLDPNPRVYTFILYEQDGAILLSDDEKNAIRKRFQFNLSMFAEAHNLTTTVGVNWLFASTDPWAPVVQDALNITALDCLGDVAKAAGANNIVPLIVPALNLSTRLTIKYTQPADNYTNCGKMYSFPNTSFALNDTGITEETPWNTRSYRPTPAGAPSDFFRYVPEITWTPKNDTLYSLMMVDPLFINDPNNTWGPYVQHYLVLNIRGNNISSGVMVNALLGPGASEDYFHKYVFLVYPQPGNITLDANETAQLNARIGHNLTAFLVKHGYSGAGGINWFYAKGDTWGPVELDMLGFRPLNCLGAVEAAARKNGIVPEVIPNIELETRLSVSFTQPAGSYINCGTEYPNPATNTTLDDTDLTTATPWNLRSYRPTPAGGKSDFFEYQPAVHWTPESASTLYTVMMVDPLFVVNQSHPWGPYAQHWMVINVPGNDTAKGVLVNPFLGPSPVETTYHRYTFVLYKQNGNITLTDAERAEIQNRINFNLTAFVDAQNLSSAVGLNWAFAQTDPWSAVQLDLLGFRPMDCFGAVQSAANFLGIVPAIIPVLDLNTQLRVAFDQPRQAYVNCETTYEPPAFNKTLSDTDPSLVIQYPWNLRSYRPGPNKAESMIAYAPQITWINETEGHLFSLIVIDPVYILSPLSPANLSINHYLIINIIGNDLSSGEVVNPYQGPAPLDSLYHKYLFLLYRQASTIALNSSEMTQLQLRKNFSLPSFVSRHTLGNPVGINWAFAQADSWSAVAQDKLGLKPLVCPPNPATMPNYIHLSPGGFAAIIIIAGLAILVLLGLVLKLRSARKVSDYNPLPGGEA